MLTADSPVAVATAAFAAFARRDWPALARCIDEVALADLRDRSLKKLIQLVEHWMAGGGSSMGFRFDGYLIEEHLESVANEEISFFPGRPTLGELASLAPGDYFLRWCGAGFEQGPDGYSFSERPDLSRAIVGVIQESVELAFVLYRLEHRDQGRLTPAPRLLSPGPMQVMPLVRRDGLWGLALNEDLGEHGFPYFDGMRVPGKKPPLNELPVVPYPEGLSRGEGMGAAALSGLVTKLQTTLDSFRRREWSLVAAVIESEFLAQLQRDLVTVASHCEKVRAARTDLPAPPGVAVGWLEEISLKPGSEELLVPLQPVPMTIAQLSALAPADFFAVIFESAARSEAGELLLAFPHVVVGALAEGPELVHLLYRTDGNEWDARKHHRERSTMKWTGDEWRWIPSRDLSNPLLAHVMKL